MNFNLELAEQLVYLYKKLCSIDDFLIIRECADGSITFSSRLGGSYRNEHFNQIIVESCVDDPNKARNNFGSTF